MNGLKLEIKNANLYLKKLINVGDIILPKSKNTNYHVYHLFVIRTNYRDELKFLKVNNIESGIHYPILLPKLKAYSYLKNENNIFLNNNDDEKLLSLPVGEHLNSNDINNVINVIKEFYSNKV